MDRYQIVVLAIPFDALNDGLPETWDFKNLLNVRDEVHVIETGPIDSNATIASTLWDMHREGAENG